MELLNVKSITFINVNNIYPYVHIQKLNHAYTLYKPWLVSESKVTDIRGTTLHQGILMGIKPAGY